MAYYARVIFKSDASVAERHEDFRAACSWIESEKNAHPAAFRLGRVYESLQVPEVVATYDLNGWHPQSLLRSALYLPEEGT